MLGRLSLVGILALAACTANERTTEKEDHFEPVSAALGDPPNFAQLGNGSAMSVVSRAWGRGAKAGALVELYYPHYDADNLWDSYVGVRTHGNFTWAHDLELVSQRIAEDSGLVITELKGNGFGLRIEDVMRPKNDAHVRHVTVTNTGSAPLADVDVDFYAFFAIDNLPTGDHVELADGALVQTDSGSSTAIVTMADRAPKVAHCGNALLWDDARGAAEGNNLSACRGADAGLTGVNGVLEHRLEPIAPGASRDVTYAIGLGQGADRARSEAKAALAGAFADRVKEDSDHWAAELARADVPARLPEDAKAVYRRAIITVLQHRVDTGAFVAASTLTSPVYKLIWPRDGSKTAVDMLETGYVPEAKGFFELLEKLLKADGSFAINYLPRASGPNDAFLDLGSAWNENDEPGMLPWGVQRVYEKTNDAAWTRARWPAVERVAEHLVAITEGGLIAPSRDLWELETGKSWTYGDGTAIAGLEAAAKIAELAGHDGARYLARAKEIRAALARVVTPEGYYGRGLDDGRVEIANLALGSGGFGLLDDHDPALAKLGDLVGARLGTPGGAVRRYEGDEYYGGQPWPVAAAWLSIHRLARGDRASAEKLFGVMTEEARSTGALMLGEQFEEGKGQWRSAFPLVWSEAAYLRTARALY